MGQSMRDQGGHDVTRRGSNDGDVGKIGRMGRSDQVRCCNLTDGDDVLQQPTMIGDLQTTKLHA